MALALADTFLGPCWRVSAVVSANAASSLEAGREAAAIGRATNLAKRRLGEIIFMSVRGAYTHMMLTYKISPPYTVSPLRALAPGQPQRRSARLRTGLDLDLGLGLDQGLIVGAGVTAKPPTVSNESHTHTHTHTLTGRRTRGLAESVRDGIHHLC